MWKQIKRCLAAFLCLTLVIGLIPAFAVSPVGGRFIRNVTETHINPAYAEEITEADLKRPEGRPADLVTMDVDDSEYLTTIEEAAAAMRESMVNREETIVIPVKWESSYETMLNDIFYSAIVHTGNPKEGDYLYYQYGGWSAGLSGYIQDGVYYLTLTYYMVYYTTVEQEAVMDEEVSELLDSLALNGLDDYEKVRSIYDWMSANIVYDHDNLNDDSYKLKHTAYAALINGTSVCQGYAVLLYRLLLESGVDCRVIVGVGNGDDHAWNIVRLNDLYYNADSTWDATYAQAGRGYEYFLRCNDNFSDHVRSGEFTTDAFNAAYPMSADDYAVTHEHDYQISNAVAPTCTEGGYMEYTCTTCGDSYREDTAAAHGHNWDGGVITTEPTVESEGVRTYTCTSCGEIRTETVDRLSADSVVASGTCGAEGDNLTWTLTAGGMLTIEGIGDMADYAISYSARAPWSGDSVTGVKIGDSVTGIGNFAFVGCSNLADVELGDSVTDIGEYAFATCTGLTGVVIPNSVTVIGQDAFQGCTGLTNVELSQSLAEISEQMFLGCTSMTGVVIPNSVTGIGKSAFEGCTALSSVKIGDSVSTIGERAFGYCSGLTDVEIGDSVTVIGESAFQSCTALTDIVIPSSVTRIVSSAFSGCSGLTEVEIPAAVTSMGYWVFASCSSLASVRFVGDVPDLKDKTFGGVTTTCYYPADNATWTEDVLQDYGGSLTWVGYSDHEHSYAPIVTDPTCTEGGYTTYVCECGDSYVADYTDPTGHIYDEWYTIDEPTCTDGGELQRDCVNCDGFETIEVEPEGHRYGDWYTVTEPTEESEGEERRNCEHCDHSESRAVAKLDHTHDYTAEVTDATCTEGGYTTYTCRCGDSYVADETEPAGHSWDSGVITVQPTEEAEGVRTCTCDACGETKTESIPKLEHTHDYTPEVTAPTCTEQGYITYTCRCGDSYVDDYVDVAGHSWDDGVVTTQPTEEAEGVRTCTCDACGETKTESIPKLEHTHDYTPEVTAPTCTEEGYTTYTCSCGDSYVDDYVEMVDHSYTSVMLPPTCVTDGYILHTCTVCGHSYSENGDPAHGAHLYEIVISLPTCTEPGYTTYTCMVCGDCRTDDYIPAVDHSYDNNGVCKSCGKLSLDHRFIDTPANAWYYSYVDFVVERGLMNGTGGDVFAPATVINRASVAVLLWNMAGKPENNVNENPFNDVKEDFWYTKAIFWAYENGIVSGNGAGGFNPNNDVTREQLAIMISNFAKAMGYELEAVKNVDLASFPDGDTVSSWAASYLKWACDLGLINGKAQGGQNYLAPKDTATRAEIAVIFTNFYKLVENS